MTPAIETVDLNEAQRWLLLPRENVGPNRWEDLLPKNAKNARKVVERNHFSSMKRPVVSHYMLCEDVVLGLLTSFLGFLCRRTN